MKTVKMPPDKLVQFLYVLLRDHVPSGVVEGIMEGHVEKMSSINGQTYYTNGYLADHALDIAIRLRDGNG